MMHSTPEVFVLGTEAWDQMKDEIALMTLTTDQAEVLEMGQGTFMGIAMIKSRHAPPRTVELHGRGSGAYFGQPEIQVIQS